MVFSLPWPFGSSTLTEQSALPDVENVATKENNFAALLRHYDAANPSALPPSARIDPTLRQQERQPLGLLDLWKYGLFVATKGWGSRMSTIAHLLPHPVFEATEVIGDVLSHHLWGPRRKSWGIEMTLITSFMRNASRHSQLADIVCLSSRLFLMSCDLQRILPI